MEAIIANRLKRVRRALETAGANTLLETHPANVYYLSGFTGDSGILLVEPSGVTLFTDGRFTIQTMVPKAGSYIIYCDVFPVGALSAGRWACSKKTVGRRLISGTAALQRATACVLDRVYPELRAGGFVTPGQPRALFGTVRYVL